MTSRHSWVVFSSLKLIHACMSENIILIIVIFWLLVKQNLKFFARNKEPCADEPKKTANFTIHHNPQSFHTKSTCYPPNVDNMWITAFFDVDEIWITSKNPHFSTLFSVDCNYPHMCITLLFYDFPHFFIKLSTFSHC